MSAIAVIVDNEPIFCQLINELLEKRHPDVLVAGVAHTVHEARELILRTRPHLLFLDIELDSEGEPNGFDLLKGIRPLRPKVIITSAYRDYGPEAVESGTFAYLLKKPFDKNQFSEAVYQALSALEATQVPDRLPVPDERGFTLLDLDTILYFKSDKDAVEVHRSTADYEVIHESLVELERKYSSAGFIRTHRQYVVNLAHVKRYDKGKDAANDDMAGEAGYLTLDNGAEIKVSRKHKPALLAALRKD